MTVGPSGEPTPAQQGFVGRRAELADLVGALRRAPGDGPIRLVSGPPGIGKTRLASELSARVEAEGVSVVWGHCWDEAGAPPYWPWTQIVRELLGQVGGTDLSALVLDDPSSAERIELFDAVTQLLCTRLEVGPLLIVLDDLHDADGPTLLLTRFVARQLQSERLLIVGTHRPVAPDSPDGVGEHLAALDRLGHSIPLRGLDPSEVGAMIGDDTTADQIHAVTGGNPLYVGQVIRSGAARDAALSGTAPTGDDDIDGLRRSMRNRIDALGDASRRAVRAAAVLGNHHDLDELRLLIDHHDAEQHRADAEAAGLLVRLSSGHGDLAHPLVGEVALSGMQPAERYDLHRRAAALTADHLERIAEHAHHLLQAGPDARAAAIAACRRGAEAASMSLAHEDASALYRRALASIGDLPETDGERLDLLLRLGDTLWRSTHPEEADAIYERAWTTATALGDSASLALAALRGGLRYNFTDESSSPWTGRTRAALDAQPPGETVLRALLLADLATRHVMPADLATGRALASDALAMARRLGDPIAIGSALLAQQVTELGPSTLQRRIDGAYEILACARAAGDYRLKIHGRFMLMGALLERGDIRALDAELLAQHDLVDDLGEPRFARFVTWFRCTRALFDGDPDTAAQIAEECHEVSQQVGDPDGLGVYGGQLGVSRWVQGRIMEMEPLFVAMRSEEPNEPLWAATLAWIWSDQGHLDAARGALADLPDPATIASTMHWLLTMTAAGEAAATVGDQDVAGTIWAQLLPYADRVVPVAMGAATWGTVAKPLGRLALRLGRVDEGLDHLAAAVDICSRLGARPWLIDAQLELARALIEHRPGDARIAGLLDEARRTAEHLGLDMFVERATTIAAGRLDRLAGPTTSSSSDPGHPSDRPRINVMGAFEVVHPDGSVARWSSRKARDLLKVLVARRGVPVAREELMDLLWPGVDPALLSNRLSVALSTIRRTLDPSRSTATNDLVEGSDDGVRLCLDAVDIDVERFLAATAPIVHGPPSSPAELAAALDAMEMRRGEVLAADPHAEWAAPLRSEVRERYLTVAHAVAGVAAAAGDHLVAADVHRRILDIDPYDDRANLGRVAAFRAMGAHGQADAAHETYVERMRELGVPPMSDTATG